MERKHIEKCIYDWRLSNFSDTFLFQSKFFQKFKYDIEKKILLPNYFSCSVVHTYIHYVIRNNTHVTLVTVCYTVIFSFIVVYYTVFSFFYNGVLHWYFFFYNGVLHCCFSFITVCQCYYFLLRVYFYMYKSNVFIKQRGYTDGAM